MPDNGLSKLQQWGQSLSNDSAAPEGLQQQARAQQAYAAEQPGFENSRLGQWANENGFGPGRNSSNWFSGQNLQGTNNGWDNAFADKFIGGWNNAMKQGTLATYFDAPTATGIVTYDHSGKDPEGNKRDYKFGDVYEDGRFKENLFDKYDKDLANQMILPWLGLDGTQQARIFGDSDPTAKLDSVVQGVREKNNIEIPKSISALEFEGNVEKREEAFREGFGDEATVLGAGLAGGGVGAGLGTLGGPFAELSVPAGFIGGFTVGTIGGLLNKDELTEAAARAYETTKLSFQDEGFGAGVGTLVQQGGQFAMAETNALQNLVHGAADTIGPGKWNDNQSAFYAVDDKGHQKIGRTWQLAGLAAAVGDAALQFASPWGRAIYLGEMGAVVGGEVTSLALSGGETFNPRSGEFQSIFVDDDGNFSPGRAAAGIGKIAIDAVQMTGVASLAGRVVRNRAAIEAGDEPLEMAGHRFLTNEAGEITGMKRTLSFLAPSEQVAWASTARAARVEAMKRSAAGGSPVVTADDYFNAATRLANGENRIKTAMVNAFGEGYEEVAQAFLEPISLGGDIRFQDVANSFFYGAAAGAGMSMGATAGAATTDQRMYAAAKIRYAIRSGGADLSEEQWGAYTPNQKRIAATMTKSDAAVTAAALTRAAEEQTADLVASSADAARAIDARRAVQERELKSASDRTDSYTVISGMLSAERGVRAEAVEASAAKILQLLEDRHKGIGLQAGFLNQRLDQLSGLEQTEEVAAQVAETRALRDKAVLMDQVGNAILDVVADMVNRIYTAEDPQTAEQATAMLNDILESMFEGDVPRGILPPEVADVPAEVLIPAVAEFTTLIHSREPKLDRGSYLAMLPRASWYLTRTRSDSLLQVNLDILQAINGDFDGDKLRAENQLVLTPDQFVQARSGEYFGGVGRDIDIAERNFDKALTEAIGFGLVGPRGQVRLAAEAAVREIERQITDRYTGVVNDADLTRILDTFVTEVKAGASEARVNLISNLARVAGEAITLHGRESLTHEWLWIGKLVRAEFQTFQRSYQALRQSDAPTEAIPSEDLATPEGQDIRKRRAANPAQNLALVAAGNTLFRKFQKIHYSSYNSSALDAVGEDVVDLADAAAWYAELSRGVTQDEVSRAEANDSVAGRVLAMLGRIVDEAMVDPESRDLFRDRHTAMLLMASTKMKNAWFGEGGKLESDGTPLSLAQILLGRALDAEREQYARTWSTDLKLQAKHARLRPLTIPNEVDGQINAERALLEVFGAVPFGDLMGDAIPPGLSGSITPEQWVNDYVTLSEEQRFSLEQSFKAEAEYLDRPFKPQPYSLTAMKRGEVTPYRAILDAMMAVGRHRQADREKQDRSAQDSFVEMHTIVRQAMRDYRELMKSRGEKLLEGRELAQQMIAADPDFARAFLELLPKSQANAVFDDRDGVLHIANWVYSMFEISDSSEALFFYWKNLTRALYNATRVAVAEDDSLDLDGRKYSKLNSRFQQLMYQLAMVPGQPELEMLVRAMDTYTDVNEFFEWVNTTPGLAGRMGAPLLPFFDDVSDFESGNGFSPTARTSGEVREAMLGLRTAARGLADNLVERTAKQGKHALVLNDLRAVRDGNGTSAQREVWRKVQRAVSVANELPQSLGPAAMLALTRGAVRGFDAQEHDKGKTPTTYEAVGEFQALIDAFGFVPGLERVMEVVTAHSLSSLRTNMADLPRTDGIAMDEFGRPIAWEPLTMDRVIEMLEDPKSTELALTQLIPGALDIGMNGQLGQRLLHDASLADVVADETYNDMFRTDNGGHLSYDRAMKYNMLVDAATRMFGGSLDLTRYATALTIAKTSALGRPATEAEYERLTLESYRDVAELLQMVGAIASRQDADAILTGIRKGAVERLAGNTISRKLKGFTNEDRDVVQTWIDLVTADLETDLQDKLGVLADDLTGAELTRQSEALQAQYEQNVERIRNLTDDTATEQAVKRFQLTGNAVTDVAAREAIVTYVRSQASWLSRAPETAEAHAKLFADKDALGVLSDSEWDQLSRSAMGVFLADQVISVSSHISIPAFPKAEGSDVSTAKYFKYLDTSYAWIVDDLLDPESALTQAAVYVNTKLADNPTGPVSPSRIRTVLDRTVLRENLLGTWTPGLKDQIIEADQRIDSSSGPSGIAMSGNGQKRWGAIAAATRRTRRSDGLAGLLSTTKFTGGMLAEDVDQLGSTLLVTLPGSTQPREMPVAQLNGRFVSALRLGGQEVDLASNNLGFTLEAEVPVRYIAVDRLRDFVTTWAAQQDIPLSTVDIEIDFLHPDSQPDSPEWMNNAYFEGMAHSLLPDTNASLIDSLWADNGGQISKSTQWMLDAGKKGVQSIAPFQRPNPDLLLEADYAWTGERDFAKMLRLKASIVMATDQGNGALDPAEWNAVYKTMKLQHLVVGTVNGERKVLTAEQVISQQVVNGNRADLVVDGVPLKDARLIVLSPDVLRTMLGDTGTQGVNRFFNDDYVVNQDEVTPYTGITDTMMKRFADGWFAEPGRLEDTSLAAVGRQRTLTVRTTLSREEASARRDRVVYLNNRRDEIRRDRRRSKYMTAESARQRLLGILRLASASVGTETTSVDFGPIGGGWVATRNPNEARTSMGLIENYAGAAQLDYTRGWIIGDQGAPDWDEGVLTVDAFGNEPKELESHLAKDDWALVQLDDFERSDPETARKRLFQALDYLRDRGVTIILGSGNSHGDLRFEAANYLATGDYVSSASSKHVFRPAEFAPGTANERAYESTLHETQTLTTMRQAVTFLAIDPIGADENVAVLNPASEKLKDRKLVTNLLPSALLSRFGLPVFDAGAAGPYGRVLAQLRHVTDPANTEARAELLKMGGQDPARETSLADSLDKFHRKITSSTQLTPAEGDRLEIGDIIPFVDARGNVVLYRHGFQLPKTDEIDSLLKRGDMRVALAETKRDALLTTNSGVIRQMDYKPGYGRQLVLEVPLQELGDKIVLEWNGMKYVVVPPSDTFEIPTAPVAGDTVVDLFTDLASAQGKEAVAGRIVGYRNALAFYGFNFLPDMQRFFFGDSTEPGLDQITYGILDALSRNTAIKMSTASALALSNAGTFVANQLADFAAELSEPGLATDWLDRLRAPSTASDQIAYAVLTYLMTENSHVNNVLMSEGFDSTRANDGRGKVRLVPGLFAQLLDNGIDSELHTELIRRFNEKHPRGADGSGYVLHPNWTVTMHGASGRKIDGYLQFGEAHSSGDNPVTDAQAYDINERQSVSPHNVIATGMSVGARTAHKALSKTAAFARSFGRGTAVEKFEPTSADRMWAMLTAVDPNEDPTAFQNRRETPAEAARRFAARQEIVGFYAPIDQSDENGWNDDQRQAYELAATRIARTLNLRRSQKSMIDTWVRQYLGKPLATDEEGKQQGLINGHDATEAIVQIRENVTKLGRMPIALGAVPLMDVNHLTAIFMANMNRENPWSPAETVDPKGPRVGMNWDAWVETAFGTAYIVNEENTDKKIDGVFDQIFLLAADGFMHGYQGATVSTRYLPVSSDILRQRQLMDLETNRMLVSLSEDQNTLTADPMMFNSERATLEDVIAGTRIYSRIRDGYDPSSAEGRLERYRARWRFKHDVPTPQEKTMRGIRRGGQTFIDNATKTSGFYRSLINLRAGMTMFSIPLVMLAPFEAFYRRSINNLANLSTGEATGGLGKGQTWLYEKFAKNGEGELTTIGEVAQYFGLTPTWDSEQQVQIQKLINALSTRSDFKAMIYQDLVYQHPSMPGVGPVSRALERFAKLGGRMQDPAWGMLPRDLARIYVETALQRISNDPTGENIYSVDQLIRNMAENPKWIEKQDHEVHLQAVARIAQIRSLKPTPMSLALRGLVEPMSENPKFLVNTAGNFLKMMTLFQNFWANYATTITGLQGASDWLAFALDGRKKGALANMQNAISGQGSQYQAKEYFDMTEVLESVDLADSFIRGGVTHAALFALGMMAGGLGLSGDDDEEKRRRRAAELQGAAYVSDPRKLQNDISNKDAVFLDFLPSGMASMFRINPDDPDSRRIAGMNFMTRSVLSPIIGMERFFNTGDFTEVIHGYKDALGAHPLMNAAVWNQVNETVAQLHEQAVVESEKGGVENHARSAGLLMTAVGVLDRMFLENSMVNMVYTGTDRYDRDPFAIPRADGEGNVARDVRGNPYATDATREYVDAEGHVREGYIPRDKGEAQFRQLTEMNFSLALLGSMWTGLTGGGFNSDVWRRNMVVKTQQVELQPFDQEQVHDGFLAAFLQQNKTAGSNAQLNYTADEILSSLKEQYRKAGVYYDLDKLEAQAKTMAANSGGPAMSKIVDGREFLTTDGAKAVFRGLMSGTVGANAESLHGVFVTMEQRETIRDEIMKELMQEGIDFGLSTSAAKARMKRLYFGELGNKDAPNINDLLFGDSIPWSDKLEYNQLNTTYMTGPDGFPRATGFKRDGLLAALGLQPLRAPWQPDDTGLGVDGRMNTVDGTAGINTGMRALERVGENFRPPTDEDAIKAAAEKIADEIAKLDFSSPFEKFGSGGGGSGGRRRSGGGYSGGGGYGYPNYSKMYELPQLRTPYGNSVPFINTSNPIIRRADVRRERVWSERGRLMQWQ